ncbi:MAG: hypothetical protein IKJ07_07005 [Clostridia bacterium]|nr:hypothetical protein [Clostridia bacterium]
MNDYELSISVEPKDKYEKAEKDLMQALISFRKLNPQEQRQLACKFFGVAQVDFVIKMMQQYNMRGD